MRQKVSVCHMTIAKPWSVEEEKQLKELVEAKTSIEVIAAKLGRRPDAIMIKCKRLKLEVVVGKGYTTTTSIAVPKELPSVEEELKVLVATLKVLVQFPLLGLFPLHPQLLVCI